MRDAAGEEAIRLRERLDRIIQEVNGVASVAIADSSGWTYRVRAAERVRAASIVKLLLLLELHRQSEANEMDLDELLGIDPTGRTGGTGVLRFMHGVQTMSAADLATLMIVVSDNAATNILVDRVGFQRLNLLAAELGLENTRFDRKMLDHDAVAGGTDNVTSADDTLALLRVINEGNVVGAASRAAMMRTLGAQRLNSKLNGWVQPGNEDPVYAHKTGELPGLEHDAGVLALAEGGVYVVALLTQLANSSQGRAVISAIGETVYRHYAPGEPAAT